MKVVTTSNVFNALIAIINAFYVHVRTCLYNQKYFVFDIASFFNTNYTSTVTDVNDILKNNTKSLLIFVRIMFDDISQFIHDNISKPENINENNIVGDLLLDLHLMVHSYTGNNLFKLKSEFVKRYWIKIVDSSVIDDLFGKNNEYLDEVLLHNKYLPIGNQLVSECIEKSKLINNMFDEPESFWRQIVNVRERNARRNVNKLVLSHENMEKIFSEEIMKEIEIYSRFIKSIKFEKSFEVAYEMFKSDNYVKINSYDWISKCIDINEKLSSCEQYVDVTRNYLKIEINNNHQMKKPEIDIQCEIIKSSPMMILRDIDFPALEPGKFWHGDIENVVKLSFTDGGVIHEDTIYYPMSAVGDAIKCLDAKNIKSKGNIIRDLMCCCFDVILNNEQFVSNFLWPAIKYGLDIYNKRLRHLLSLLEKYKMPNMNLKEIISECKNEIKRTDLNQEIRVIATRAVINNYSINPQEHRLTRFMKLITYDENCGYKTVARRSEYIDNGIRKISVFYVIDDPKFFGISQTDYEIFKKLDNDYVFGYDIFNHMDVSIELVDNS